MIKHKPGGWFGGWEFKASYIPSSLTNFNSEVKCPTNFHKFGALCYVNEENKKSCDDVGY